MTKIDELALEFETYSRGPKIDVDLNFILILTLIAMMNC